MLKFLQLCSDFRIFILFIKFNQKDIKISMGLKNEQKNALKTLKNRPNPSKKDYILIFPYVHIGLHFSKKIFYS